MLYVPLFQCGVKDSPNRPEDVRHGLKIREKLYLKFFDNSFPDYQRIITDQTGADRPLMKRHKACMFAHQPASGFAAAMTGSNIAFLSKRLCCRNYDSRQRAVFGQI